MRVQLVHGRGPEFACYNPGTIVEGVREGAQACT